MALGAYLTHLFATRAGTRRRFTDGGACESIESAIARRESAHQRRNPLRDRNRARRSRAAGPGVTPRERALQVFAHLRVWDTELRNGVLIYVLMADRDVEIVADRGAAARISPTEWEAACRLMEEPFPRRPLRGRAPWRASRPWADC